MEPPMEDAQFGDQFRADLLRLLRWRRDVRSFKRQALAEGTLERLVGLACLAPSVGLSQPWRFVVVETPSRRDAIRASFETCNADALLRHGGERAGLYARLKLAGLDDAPCQFAVFADRETAQGHGLGRLTMPETIDYSAVMAVHTLWLAARAEGLGLGWISILDPGTVSGCARYAGDLELHRLFLPRLSELCRRRPLAGTGGLGRAPRSGFDRGPALDPSVAAP